MTSRSTYDFKSIGRFSFSERMVLSCSFSFVERGKAVVTSTIVLAREVVVTLGILVKFWDYTNFSFFSFSICFLTTDRCSRDVRRSRRSVSVVSTTAREKRF